MSETEESGIGWDDRLVAGFRFACLPGCGLCCFTEPRIARGELSRFDSPAARLPTVRAADGELHLASFPEGGSCRMLASCRCSIYSQRPRVCDRFPVHLHGGPYGWQVSVVLSCPGLSIDALDAWAGRGGAPSEPTGLASELASARLTSGDPEARSQWAQSQRDRTRVERRLQREGRWASPEEMRSALRAGGLRPALTDMPGEPLPSPEDGIEYLPLVYDRRAGPVALSDHPGGWRLAEVAPSGGWAGWTEVLPIPAEIPSLSETGGRLLDAYLAYWMARDVLYDRILWTAVEPNAELSVTELARAELRWIGATVLARGAARARARGQFEGPLDVPAVRLGIEATDADLLDRPDLGARP